MKKKSNFHSSKFVSRRKLISKYQECAFIVVVVDLIRCNAIAENSIARFPRVVNQRRTITEQFFIEFQTLPTRIRSKPFKFSIHRLILLFPSLPTISSLRYDQHRFIVFNIIELEILGFASLSQVSFPHTLHPGTRRQKIVSISRRNGVTFQTGSY